MFYIFNRKERQAIEKIKFAPTQFNPGVPTQASSRLILALLAFFYALCSGSAWAQAFGTEAPDTATTGNPANVSAVTEHTALHTTLHTTPHTNPVSGQNFAAVPVPLPLRPDEYKYFGDHPFDDHAFEDSPFDDSQLNTLVAQGSQQQEAGNHQQAVELFTTAWQSSRVANGLYHAAQLPLLESMIVSRIELEDWQAVDDHYAYLELIYTRLYELDDLRLESGLQAVSSWHINAFNLNLDGRREQHMRKARNILKMRLEVAQNTLEEGHPRFAFLHESIRLSEQHLYLMSERYKQQLRKQERAERDRLLATLQ